MSQFTREDLKTPPRSDRLKVTKLGDVEIDEATWVGSELAKARDRLKSGIIVNKETGFYSDSRDHVFIDVSKIIQNEEGVKRQIALNRHGNDPNNRLDECGFPFDRKDRHFTLNHDFGEDLNYILSNIKRAWIYLFGDPGRGKTSLAIRAVWEMIKNYPERQATFLPIGKWINSLMAGNKEFIDIHAMKRIVLVDDFDKFDKTKEFQIKQLLLLIEELKNRHLVIITANHSITELKEFNRSNLDLDVMLDRIRGKSIIMPRFTGVSFR